MKDKQTKNSQTSSGSSAVTGYMPVLRFSLSFDLNLNSILWKFTKNTTQTIPITIKCGVEKLSESKLT